MQRRRKARTTKKRERGAVGRRFAEALRAKKTLPTERYEVTMFKVGAAESIVFTMEALSYDHAQIKARTKHPSCTFASARRV